MGKFAVLYLDQKDASVIQRDFDKKAHVCFWRERDHHLHCDRLCDGGVQRDSQTPPTSSGEAWCCRGALLRMRLADSRLWPPCLVSKAAVRARARRWRSGGGRDGRLPLEGLVKLPEWL